MKRQCMLYFPATSQDGLSRLYKLQHASKSNHMLKKFLQSVHRTLRKDVTEFVYPSERARLGDCDIDLFLLAKQQQRHPYGPIQMILTLSIQLAELVLRMTSDEIDGVLAAGAGIGLLSGALSAVVHDSWDVVQLSQYIVSLAFRFGIELERRGRNIDCSESAWEPHVMVIESLSQLESELNRVNLATPVHLRAYAGIISVSNKTATLFGPPSTLAKFKDPDELKSTCLYGPATMFAPHLQPLDVVAILQSIPTSNCTRSILRPVVSPTDGKPYEASNFQDLLIQVLNDIAGRRVDMDCLTAGIVAQRGAESADLVLFGSDPDAREVANAVSLIGLPIQTVNRTHISSLNQPTDDAVAVIGMAGRFPESDNVEELWSLLESGTSTAKKIPPSRFLPNEETAWDYTGHFIKRPGVFDHALFAISPVEAMQMDPIQRMALLTTYEALEMAGYSGCDAEFGPDPSRVAVFFGQTTDDWKSINQQRGIDMHYLPGLNRSFTPGRISRYFGWSGGFYSIDTGCSSSATCLCLARDALLSGQIDMAIVGGGNLLNTPEWYQGLGKGGFLSATGACKTFAESADGYCRGEAVGVVVLKRQEDALRAKDNILASITSASRNANARTSASLTAPSQKAQEVLYGHVLRETGICPSEVDYVEMHGTGTQLGDSIEMAAVANVLAEGHDPQHPLIVGAVKASIGHSEAAAGVVSLIKAVLVLQKNKVPPQPGWPFALNAKFHDILGQRIAIANGQDFSRNRRTLIVNSFDAAGGNVSMVVQDALPSSYRAFCNNSAAPRTPSHQVVVISGHSKTSFENFQARLLDKLASQSNIDLPSLAYSTTARRMPKKYRRSLVVASIAELAEKLSAPCCLHSPIDRVQPNMLFTFTGQGAQYAGMGATLYQTLPYFRQLLDSYEQHCQSYGLGFLNLITQAEDATLASGQFQVAIAALEMALASYLMSLGLQPDFVIGHSIGEYAALFVAGVLSAYDVLWLLHHRARLLEQTNEAGTHGMLSVNLPALTIQKQWGEECEISCYNTPNLTVVSAPMAHILDLEAKMKNSGTRVSRLNVDFAFHSSKMDPICASFSALAEQVSFQPPRIPVASTVLGRIVNPGEAIFDACYLARHTRQAVEFVAATQACEDNGLITDDTVIVEIGPHPTSIGLLQASLRAARPTAVATLQRGKIDWYGISTCLAVAHDAGKKVAWNEFHKPYLAHLEPLSLPQTSFDYREFWEPFRKTSPQPTTASSTNLLSSTLHRLHSLSDEGSQTLAVFYSSLSEAGLFEGINGHVVDGSRICPASVFMDIMMSAATYLMHGNLTKSVTGIELTELNMTSPLAMEPQDKHQQIRIEARLDRGSKQVSVNILAAEGDAPLTYATGQIAAATAGERQEWSTEWTKIWRLVEYRSREIESMAFSEKCMLNQKLFYHMFAEIVNYGNSYRTIREASIAGHFCDAVATFQFESCPTDAYACNPFMVDSMVHLVGFLLNAKPSKQRHLVCISNHIKSLRLHGELSPNREYRIYASIREYIEGGIFICDAYVFDDPSMLLLSCEGIRFQHVDRALFKALTTRVPSQSNDPEVAARDSGYCSSNSLTRSPNSNSCKDENPIDIIHSTISAATGLSVREIHGGKTFGDLGIDSQLSISIMASLKRTTGIELAASLFAPTSSILDVQRELEVLLPNLASATERVREENKDVQASSLELDNIQNVSNCAVLLRIVACALGIETDELHDSSTWQSLGLDSMQSIQILSVFRKQTGIELPAAFFFEHPKVGDVRRQLGSCEDKEQQSSPSCLPDPAPLTQEDSGPTSRAILLQGSAQSQDPPLFLLTDGSGTVEAYVHLDKLPNGRRTYGLESPFVNNPLDYTMTISQVAKVFIKTIRSIQPHGPYFVGGWSVGGKYAYEVSRQLSLANEEIALLLIIDTRPPRPRPLNIVVGFGTLDDIGMTTARGKNLADDFTERERDHLYASCRVQSREQTRAFAEDQSHPWICAICWATKGLNEQPDPNRHRLEVTRKAAMGNVEQEEEAVAKGGIDALRMIYKSWLFGKREDFGTNGWERWVGSRAGIVVETVEADHFSMVARPDVAQLSRIIIRLITKAAAKYMKN